MRAPDASATPLVSVLIPCHNAGAYLAATLDSVMIQAGVAWEVILIDDGSTDDSAAIASRYADHVRVVAGPRRGASAARNLATSLARGKYFQYLDADDLLAPGALAARTARLEATGADVALSEWQRLVPDPAGVFQPGPIVTPVADQLRPDAELAVFLGLWAPPAALLYRREIVSAIGLWREDLPVIQDARFLFDAARAGARFEIVAGVSAYYRQHATGSLSTSNSTRFWADVLENTRQIEALWRQDSKLVGERLSAIGNTYADLARTLFRLDETLFRAALTRLDAHASASRSRYLRLAVLLDRLIGYRAARHVLNRLRRLG